MIEYPDYVPENVRLWAQTHQQLLELVVEELLRTGAWQPLGDLTRRLVREQRPAPLRSIFWEMPKELGLVETNPEHVVLTPFGLRMTHAGHELLDGLTAILKLAAERYESDDSEPVIARADIAHKRSASEPYVSALSEILLRGTPFLGAGAGGPSDEWRREVTDDIVRYWDARRTEAYLRTRAKELAWAGAARSGPVSATQPGTSVAEIGASRPGVSELRQVISADGETSHRLGGEAVTSLLAAGTEGALREALRAGRGELAREIRELSREHGASQPVLRKFFPTLEQQMLLVVDQTIPLIRHRSALIDEQAHWFGQLAAKRYIYWGVAAWVELPRWIAWCISRACGAYAVSIDELGAVRAMLGAGVDHGIPGVSPESLASIGPGHASQVASQLVGGASASASWLEQWSNALRNSPRLQMAVPEFFEGDDRGPLGWLLAYTLLCTVFSGQRQQQAASPWIAYADGGYALTSRLHRDDVFLAHLADTVFRCSTDEFRENADMWLGIGLGGNRASLLSPFRSSASLRF